jgi:hypothetical protein
MPSLHQLIAAHKTIASTAAARFDTVHHRAQAHHVDGPFHGKSRVYRPKDQDNGEQLPAEYKRVQLTADELIADGVSALTDFFDATATRDWANCEARADVKIGDKTIVKQAPVSFLLWLEKQLVNQRTLIQKLPVLSAEETWTWDDAQACYVSRPTISVRTTKTPRNHELAPAVISPNGNIEKAQVQVYMDDVAQGEWTVVKHSGALPMKQVRELLARIQTLLIAVKYAREEANRKSIDTVQVARPIFGYLYQAS